MINGFIAYSVISLAILWAVIAYHNTFIQDYKLTCDEMERKLNLAHEKVKELKDCLDDTRHELRFKREELGGLKREYRKMAFIYKEIVDNLESRGLRWHIDLREKYKQEE